MVARMATMQLRQGVQQIVHNPRPPPIRLVPLMFKSLPSCSSILQRGDVRSKTRAEPSLSSCSYMQWMHLAGHPLLCHPHSPSHNRGYCYGHCPHMSSRQESHTGTNVAELLCKVPIEGGMSEKDAASVADYAGNMVIQRLHKLML